MFRRYPYWGWLLISLLLWCTCTYEFHLHSEALQPVRMARLVNNDLHHRENVFEKFITEQGLIRRSFTDSLSPKETERISAMPFFIYCYDHDTLKAWNTNVVIGYINDTAFGRDIIVQSDNGVFIERCLKPVPGNDAQTLVVLFPVLFSYPIENNYLRSHFAASDNIPPKTRVVAGNNIPGTYPVSISRNVVFSLQFNTEDLQKWMPDTPFTILFIAALLVSISWLQLTTIHYARKTSVLKGFTATILLIAAIQYLLYYHRFPFNLESLTFFSPLLYATNKVLSSFGVLFIDVLCLLWVVIFITRHTPYRNYFKRLKNTWGRLPIAITLMAGMFAYVALIVYVIHSLVHDSSISFDVSHFYAINIYSVLGLLIIGSITGISCLIIYIFNIQFNMLVPAKWVRYLLVTLTGVILVVLHGNYSEAAEAFDWTFYWGVLAWILVFIILLDIPGLGLVSDLFEPHMVLWAVYFCAFGTGLLQYFNQAKERDARIAYVKGHLAPERDYELEYSFENKTKNIEQDKYVKCFLLKPSAPARKILDQHLNTQYLSSPSFSKYQLQLYLFDAKGKNLFNKDTTAYATLLDVKGESDPTNTGYLFYKESIHDLHLYLAYIPIYSDTVNNVIGYALIDLGRKKQVAGTVYPELLQTTDKSAVPENEYSVGTYINDKLNTQTNDYDFPAYLHDDTLKKPDESVYRTGNGEAALYYKINDKRTLVVIHKHSFWTEVISIFSYLFVILVLLAAIISFYQLCLSYFAGTTTSHKLIRLTLRRRLRFSMLGVVLLAFIIIGIFTIAFFNYQYQESSADKLQSAMQVVKQAVKDELKKEGAYSSSYVFDTVTRSPHFKAVVTAIAGSQKIDLNIFNRKGALVNTSEDDIYEKGLISRAMRPDAYYALNNLGKSILIQHEEVADLPYLSAYLPLRDDQGVTMGYINVPFFSSQKDLKFQVSNIVVTLINFYAFIFLMSSLFSVFVARWITNSFNMIIEQFGRINLQKNERITWPYDDEIGMLVNEYNKMVNKVEENAAKLAQSERESAWREMARQVAHEIKNPLTPMKLNIQFLRQSMQNDHPNIKELTDKLSASIIEQIDNLSYIASEFSNFAKMPEARPEILDVCGLLGTALKLYLNDEHINVTISESDKGLQVYSDHSQLLRVFTNLLENAKQAIPESREGRVAVRIKAESGDAIIAITDNGAGITEEVAQKIFQPYFTTKTSGTGLGLAMTKKIIEFWNGSIWFETAEGEGTTFYIRLPLHPGPGV